MTTGERMKHRRKSLGISAELLASKLGLSPATIYRYEKGEIEKIPGKFLEPLSEALSTSPAYLMGWSDNPEPISGDYVVVPTGITEADSQPQDSITSNSGSPNLRWISAHEMQMVMAYRQSDDRAKQDALNTLLTHPRSDIVEFPAMIAHIENPSTKTAGTKHGAITNVSVDKDVAARLGLANIENEMVAVKGLLTPKRAKRKSYKLLGAKK